jgi:predicted nucleotidyltransferase component of viral defense system
VSLRDFPNSYDVKNFYGTNVQVLKVGDIISHKLVAIRDRKVTANRDIFDSHYFLSSKYATEINEEIIKYRTGLDTKEFFTSLLDFIDDYDPENPLSGLGELIDEEQKEFVRSGQIVDEFRHLLQRQIDLFK